MQLCVFKTRNQEMENIFRFIENTSVLDMNDCTYPMLPSKFWGTFSVFWRWRLALFSDWHTWWSFNFNTERRSWASPPGEAHKQADFSPTCSFNQHTVQCTSFVPGTLWAEDSKVNETQSLPRTIPSGGWGRHINVQYSIRNANTEVYKMIRDDNILVVLGRHPK